MAAEKERPPLLVSACLLGLCTRLDGGHNLNDGVVALSERFLLIPVCPEQLGGLPTPREPAEIRGGTGLEVLSGGARVSTPAGADVTEQFLRGARAAVTIAELAGATAAVLKARSPSCGVWETYDGSFSRQLVSGPGVTGAALREAGLRVMTDEDVMSQYGESEPGVHGPER